MIVAKNDGNDGNDVNPWEVFSDDDDDANNNTHKQKIQEMEDETNVEFLKDCTHSEVVYDYHNGYEICGQCGRILQERLIDRTPEWRCLKGNQQFSNDPVRCSVINPLLPKSSLSTKIVTNGRPSPKSYLLAKMNKWQSMPYMERSMYDVFTELDEKCRPFGINKAILQAAKIFYSNVYRKNTELLKHGGKREGLRGRKRKGLISACVFFACKQNNEPQSQTQISKILGIQKSYVTKGCKIFLDLMKNDRDCGQVLDVTDGKHFVKQFGKNLDLDYFSICYALDMYKEVKDYGLFAGNQPPSIAAGVLFIILNCSNPCITESYVAKKCGISKVTIANVCRQLESYKAELLFNVYVKNYYKKMQIINQFTYRKILFTGQKILRTVQLNIHPQLFAATIIYMILFYQNVQRLEKQWYFKQISPWTEHDICSAARPLIFYKQFIINDVVNGIIIPSNKKTDVSCFRANKRVSLLTMK